MKQRQIGANGPWVGALGLGCMGMSFAYGDRDDAGSADTLLRALDLGVTHFDTADMYGWGHNEELVGRVLRARRDEFVLATKFGNRQGEREGAHTSFIDSSADYAVRACDASLARLGTDHIDLYYMHRRDPEVPIEETVGAMASLVEAGKIRHIGLSEVSPATLRAAAKVAPIAAVQMEYSLFSRGVEEELLSTCRELGVALVAYSPVGRGMLTGTVTSRDDLAEDDFRRSQPRWDSENFAKNAALVEAVRGVAGEIGVTPAQAALAWLLAQDELILPIPGTKRVAYLEENVGAGDVDLSAEQVERLSAAVPPDEVAGLRYSAAGMARVEQ